MSDIARFIVLGCGRTGSNLLVSMLNSHPHIRCMNELFNDADRSKILWGVHARQESPDDLELRDREPVRFLEERVFTNVEASTRFVGFKIFYYHARTPQWEPVWLHLRADPDLRVIHIKRRNRLRKHLSEKIANLTKKWAITSDRDVHRDVTIKLWPHQCIASFERTIAQEQEAEAFFRDHAVHEVAYEDLAADPAACSRRVLEFLGAAPQPLQQGTRRQIVQPLSQIIENYDEIAAAFAGTPWASFLDDDTLGDSVAGR
ncbi:MAG: sulfotransferase [Planctomycetes bacterium]|nr:sulfotransferase [Planctomycetota bacterium]